MRSARWIGSTVVVLLAGQVAWAAPHKQAPNVVDLTTVPFTISEPGTYIVDRDWAVTTLVNSQPMIDITASDVVLDLRGFEIAQDGSEGIILVAIAGDRVTVRNGRLKGRPISALAFRSTGGTTVVDSVNVKPAQIRPSKATARSFATANSPPKAVSTSPEREAASSSATSRATRAGSRWVRQRR